jgi:hypothetical protein
MGALPCALLLKKAVSPPFQMSDSARQHGATLLAGRGKFLPVGKLIY